MARSFGSRRPAGGFSAPGSRAGGRPLLLGGSGTARGNGSPGAIQVPGRSAGAWAAVQQVPQGDPDDSPVFSDFQNGVYGINGEPVLLSDVWVGNENYGESLGGASVVNGVGLRVIATNQTITADAKAVLSSAAADGLLPSDGGFTMVLDYILDSSDDEFNGFSQIELEVVDFPDWNHNWAFLAHDDAGTPLNTSINVSDYEGLTDISRNALPGFNRVAVTMTPTRIAFSLNGAAQVVGPTPEVNTTATHICFNAEARTGGAGADSTTIVQKVRFLAPVADADLPALSAL